MPQRRGVPNCTRRCLHVRNVSACPLLSPDRGPSNEAISPGASHPFCFPRLSRLTRDLSEIGRNLPHRSVYGYCATGSPSLLRKVGLQALACALPLTAASAAQGASSIPPAIQPSTRRARGDAGQQRMAYEANSAHSPLPRSPHTSSPRAHGRHAGNALSTTA